ncbi:MAG: selenocysteine-specific translation elongation factor [Sandaracinaceae bacterium]|nr:selenocysteine-specific translation elongation factor [Sandaracinaceae bacterium]
MIVGTAGHVNHGKTTLIEALTGVSCDRLEQERARGMTIELGFAPWTLPSGRRVSVIDVPGHSRFARTMAAGALGMDAAILVVAADEGWMPQTHEHVATCQVLGVKRVVVALTRIDRAVDVDTSLRFVREKLDATVFAGAPIVRVCAPKHEGLDELAARVAALADDPAADRALPLLLPVDRVFTQKGFGTVVTSSLLRGALAVGDRITVYPARREARVRTLHVHGEAVERVEARARVALNLADASAEEVPRGSLLGAPGQLCVGRVFDAELDWLAHNGKALSRARSLGWGQGPARAIASVVCDPPLKPGQRGVGRVHLDREVALVGGTRFVLRGASDRKRGAVVGGGRIVDAAPPRRRAAAVRARLAEAPTIEALLEEAGARGVDPALVGARLGLAPLPKGPRRFADAAVERAAAKLVEQVTAHVSDDPSSAGLPLESLRRAPISAAAIARAVSAGSIAREGNALRPATHRRDPSPVERLAARALTAIGAAKLAGPREHDLERTLGANGKALAEALAHLEATGAIARSQGFCFAMEHLAPLRATIARAAIERGSLPFTFLKDHAGLSRKHAMPLWTWLDREGVTVRRGDARAAGPAAAAHAG